jgi:hypothetical protein
MASRAVSLPARSHPGRRSTVRKLALVPVVPPGHDERYAAGKALRDRVPRKQHAEWAPSRQRRDPVEIVMQSSKGRISELVPIRYGRMMVSPFTFYRGTADIMAADLVATPVTGLRAQLCGDCHLLNFNGYATPERRLIFDINDFDETLPRSLGMGRKAPGGELRPGSAVEWFFRSRPARCRSDLPAIVSRTHGRICRDAGARGLVRASRSK